MATLRRTSTQYQVSTDRLVEGLNQLGESLGVLSLAGATGEVSRAITELGGKFPGLTGEIGSFVDKLAMTDISQAGVLGVMADLDRITSGQVKSGEELRAVIQRVSIGAKRFTGDFKRLQLLLRGKCK